jgi:hypothetical protein
MDYRTRRVVFARWTTALVLLAMVIVYTGKSAVRTNEAATILPQDVTHIESRLSQLEQRFYSMETSIRGLEQQQRLSGITSGRTVRDPEISLLRGEVEALRQRLAEVECGLVRVDERTLSEVAKQGLRKSAVRTSDPCRLNADTPLRLASRP